MTDPVRQELRAAILELVRERGPEKSICPSEAARRLYDDWRDRMPAVREVAANLQRENKIEVLQGGNPVDPESASGPIRLHLPEDRS